MPNEGFEKQRKGDIAEMKVASRLVELGATVSIPQTSSRYDLIADFDGSLFRVQVKCGYGNSGDMLEVGLESTVHNSRGEATVKHYTSDEIDGVAAYAPEWDQCFWIPIGELPKTQLKIRRGKPEDFPRNADRIRFSHDYLLENIIP